MILHSIYSRYCPLATLLIILVHISLCLMNHKVDYQKTFLRPLKSWIPIPKIPGPPLSPTPASSSPTLCHAEAATHCRPERPLSSSTPWNCDPRTTHTVVDPSDPVKHQQTLPSQYRGATTNPDHSVWEAHLSHCLTPLPRTLISKIVMRPSRSPSHHRVHHCTLHDSNMDQACFSQHLQTTSTTTSKNEGAPNMTPPRRSQCKVLPSHVQMDEVFTLRTEPHMTRA
jgi:hypothetical protein